MRMLPLFFLAGLGMLALPACGGGGGGALAPASSAPQALVLGVVVSRDGSAAELDGIRVESSDGETLAVTDTDGRFEAPVPANRRFRLRFNDPRAEHTAVDEDIAEGEDDTPDDTDIDGDELEIDDLDEDEVCEVEVELEDGDVVGSWVEREKRGDDGERRREHDGETSLCPPEGKVEGGPRGELELAGEGDCLRLEIEAEGLDEYDLLEAVIELPDGTEVVLGTLDVNDKGEVHFVFEACDADEMPFGVESFEGMAGAKIWILDDLDAVILAGKLPMRRGEHDDDRERDGEDHGKDEGEKRDGEKGDGEKPEGRVEDFALTAPVDGSEAKGGGVVKCFPDCCVLIVEIGQVGGPADYDLVLVGPDGAEAELGQIEVGEKGFGRFAEEFCEELPFEADSLASLAGYGVLVLDADGEVVLQGTLPAFPVRTEEESSAE